jgi:hypothetical protein
VISFNTDATALLTYATYWAFAVKALLIPETADVNVLLTAPTNRCVAATSIPVAFIDALISSIIAMLSAE